MGTEIVAVFAEAAVVQREVSGVGSKQGFLLYQRGNDQRLMVFGIKVQ